MTAEALPTKEEINPFEESLDGQTAVEDFFGKTVDEAEGMFRENAGHCWESLHYLGPVAFRFYIPAAIKYLHDELPDTQPPTISWFLDIVDIWLEFQPDELAPVAMPLNQLLGEYLARYARFDEHDSVESQIGDILRSSPEISKEFVEMVESQLEQRPGLRTRMSATHERLLQLCDDPI